MSASEQGVPTLAAASLVYLKEWLMFKPQQDTRLPSRPHILHEPEKQTHPKGVEHGPPHHPPALPP